MEQQGGGPASRKTHHVSPRLDAAGMLCQFFAPSGYTTGVARCSTADGLLDDTTCVCTGLHSSTGMHGHALSAEFKCRGLYTVLGTKLQIPESTAICNYRPKRNVERNDFDDFAHFAQGPRRNRQNPTKLSKTCPLRLQ